MSVHFSPTVEGIRAAHWLRPNYSEIARELNVTPQHVRRVFLGLSTSDRVAKAIAAKVRQKARKNKKDRERAA